MTIGIGVSAGATPGFANFQDLTVSPAASGSAFAVVIYIGGSGNSAISNATASSCTCSTTVLTVGGSITGTWAVGQFVIAPGVPSATFISSLGTGVGGAGTYNLSASATVGSPVAMTASNVCDSNGNIYALSIGSIPVQAGNNFGYIYTCQNAVGGASMAVHWRPFNGNNTVMQFIEVTGVATPTSIDQISGNTSGTGTTMACPGVTTTQAAELILGICEVHNTSLNTVTATTGTLIRYDNDTTNFIGIASSQQIVAAAGTYTPSFSGTASANWGNGTVSFIQAGGGPPPPVPARGPMPRRVFILP